MTVRRGPRHRLLRLLNLRGDQADTAAIDATIRSNAEVAGTNLWVLMFAIVIASVGLNVNSTAVIIGAMLISPLMGPIIGIGYGASIHDYDLIRQCLRTLGIFVGISLGASSVYFLLTPLTIAHSELLARTSPTLWDVLIAFFGGAAGMVGLTRKEKTTLIPGVAIATALMPPICTAGYGLATLQPQFFLGAFYLFLINAVFIALATLAIARILRLPEHAFPDEITRRRGRHLIGAAILLTLVPSTYLAYDLVRQEVFVARAKALINERIKERPDIALIAQEIEAKDRVIALTLFGNGVTSSFLSDIESALPQAGLAGAKLSVIRATDQRIDLDAMRADLRRDAIQGAVRASEHNAARIARLEQELAGFQGRLDELARIEREIRAQLPSLRKVRVTLAANQTGAPGEAPTVLVYIEPTMTLSKIEQDRLLRWLDVRVPESGGVELAVGQRSR